MHLDIATSKNFELLQNHLHSRPFFYPSSIGVMSPLQLRVGRIGSGACHAVLGLVPRQNGESDSLCALGRLPRTDWSAHGGALSAACAHCGRSALIWASSRTGDPYFVILGASLLPLA